MDLKKHCNVLFGYRPYTHEDADNTNMMVDQNSRYHMPCIIGKILGCLLIPVSKDREKYHLP